jgi:nucleoside-diphosphate-sugar epimerase
MKRILVTGATGGLGRNAVDALLAKGIAVRATGRNTQVGQQLARQGAEFVALDLATATPAQLQALVQDTDAVWHCAALSAPWGAKADFVAANITVTKNLLDAAGRSSIERFVHISTPAIYFDYRNHWDVKESFQPAQYVNDYARTKAQAEAAVQAAVLQLPHMRSVILRPRAIFGRYDQVLIPRLCRVLAQRGGKLPLPKGGQVTLDLTYAENVVHAMWLATTHTQLASGAVFNITNHTPAVLKDVLQQLFVDALHRPFRIVKLPYPLLAAVAQGMQTLSRLTQKEPALTPYSIGALSFDMTLNTAQASQVLGYTPPVSLAEGIDRTAQWMLAHG